MKKFFAIVIFSFLRQETKLIINAIKFPYNFVKEFSILRFLCYLIDNSITPNRDKIFSNNNIGCYINWMVNNTRN
jgi:hypothetical protein